MHAHEDPANHLTPALAHAIVRVAEILHEVCGAYDRERVDLPELLAYALAAEIYRRGLVWPHARGFRYASEGYTLNLLLEGSLLLGDDGVPTDYRERGLVSEAPFRDLRVLDDDQLRAVLAHAIGVLADCLTALGRSSDAPGSAILRDTREILTMAGFDSGQALARDAIRERVKHVQAVVAKLAEEVALHHLDALYARHLLFASE